MSGRYGYHTLSVLSLETVMYSRPTWLLKYHFFVVVLNSVCVCVCVCVRVRACVRCIVYLMGCMHCVLYAQYKMRRSLRTQLAHNFFY